MLRPAEHHNLNSAVEPQWGATTTKTTLDLRVDSKNILGTSDTGHKQKGATHTPKKKKKKKTTRGVFVAPTPPPTLTHSLSAVATLPAEAGFCFVFFCCAPPRRSLTWAATLPGRVVLFLLRPRRTRRANKNNVWPTTSGLETTRRGNSQKKKKQYFLTSKP